MLKKNNILKLFKITANNIVKVNDLIGMWAQIDLGVEYLMCGNNSVLSLDQLPESYQPWSLKAISN